MNSAHQTLLFFFFNDTATTEIYTLSLHDALPIYSGGITLRRKSRSTRTSLSEITRKSFRESEIILSNVKTRSEEHTSELQSQSNLVCRLLLEKKKKQEF